MFTKCANLAGLFTSMQGVLSEHLRSRLVSPPYEYLPFQVGNNKFFNS
jgi:hypothetical protein